MNNTSAINFKELRCYNNEWNLNQRVLFIKIVFLSSRNGRVITMGNRLLQLEFGWKRHETVNLVQRFIDLGFISPLQTGVKQNKKYTVHFDTILASTDKIYQLDHIEDVAQRNDLYNHLVKDLRARLNAIYISGSYKKKIQLKFTPDAPNDGPLEFKPSNE